LAQQFNYVEFKALDDLVRFVAGSPKPFLHHIVINGKNIYFVQVVGFGGGRAVYYVEREEKFDGRYIIFNRFRDEVSFSDKLVSDGQSVCVNVLELKRTNIFSEYPPK
jgi:hypothetical protein